MKKEKRKPYIKILFLTPVVALLLFIIGQAIYIGVHMKAFCPENSDTFGNVYYNGHIYCYTNLEAMFTSADESYDNLTTCYFTGEYNGKRIYIYDENSPFFMNFSFINVPMYGFENDPNEYIFMAMHDEHYVRDDFNVPTLIDNNGIDKIIIEPGYRPPADNAFIITNQELISKIVNTALTDRDFSPYITSVDDYSPEVMYNIFVQYTGYPLFHKINQQVE